MSNIKLIVGLDLSLTATGWATYNTESKVLNSGTVNSKLKGMDRLDEIVTLIEGMIVHLFRSLKTPITWIEAVDNCEVYIENYGFASKGRVVYQGELGGIVRYMLWKHGVKYHDIPPTIAKKVLTGKGNCEKSLILKELYKKYKIDVDDDNIADACNLVIIGKMCHGLEKMTKAQKEIIDTKIT
jgi:Holliday junction resolvasome RuvABC endonuclease subunit